MVIKGGQTRWHCAVHGASTARGTALALRRLCPSSWDWPKESEGDVTGSRAEQCSDTKSWLLSSFGAFSFNSLKPCDYVACVRAPSFWGKPGGGKEAGVTVLTDSARLSDAFS